MSMRFSLTSLTSTDCESTPAAHLDQDAGVEKQFLVHQAYWFDDQGQTERAYGDVTSTYDGEVIWGREIMKDEGVR